MADPTPSLYDSLGLSYPATRREDPRLAVQIHAALGDARTVVNVGAGTGSYEPRDREVVAVEPSVVMIAGRPPEAAPVVQASAESLPLPDRAFDAAMALWTIHHWTDVGRALGELRRVAGRVVVLAPAPRMNELWMTADYFPDMAGPRTRPEIQPEAVAEALGGVTRIITLLVPRDCRDWFGEALWGRPELYLDPDVRANMSAFRLIDPSAVDAGVDRLRRDLETGAWDRRHGSLRSLPEIDAGHRIVVSDADAG
jgi:SAM-dependent methyltransferase